MYYTVEFTVFDRTGIMDGMSMSTVVKAKLHCSSRAFD